MSQRFDRQAAELAAIIDESAARVRDRKLSGRELRAERQACSKAIAAACERHRAEPAEPEDQQHD